MKILWSGLTGDWEILYAPKDVNGYLNNSKLLFYSVSNITYLGEE